MLNVEKSLSIEKLTQSRWAFGPSGKSPATTKLHFRADGKIDGYPNPGEALWSYKGGRLELHVNHDLLCVLTELYVNQGSIHLVMQTPNRSDAEYLLYECTPSGRKGYSGNSGYTASQFLFPRDLHVTPTNIRQVLIVGSCLAEVYKLIFEQKYPETKFDFVLMNTASRLPESPPSLVEQYDFQYLQLPLRTVVSDRIITGGRLNDEKFFTEVLVDGCNIIDAMLDAGLAYCKRFGLLSLVSNFIVPQMNVVTDVKGRGTSNDLSLLVRRLNEHLATAVSRFDNAFLCDVDALSSSVGKRFFLDDITGFYTHGAIFGQEPIDLVPNARIERVPPISSFYESKSDDFLDAVFDQMIATYRTVRQLDQVKAVIFDLDNTLWRGQIAEDFRPEKAPWPRGGWQNGIWEAVQNIRARGILVAICSKNDEDVVRNFWENVVQPPFLQLEDFASVKINWKSKPENVAEICREFNITPKGVVFVDDNPVEREAVRSAFPEIRTMGSNPYLTRRILLWAPEMQVPRLTGESKRREESIRGQIERDQVRAVMSREEFLKSLNCSLKIVIVDHVDQPQFSRVLELTNKTNQFNTTGARWTHAGAVRFFGKDGKIVAFEVSDKFSQYGIVGAAYLIGHEIVQFVMSCRVMGLDVEQAVLAKIVSDLNCTNGENHVGAVLEETVANHPCRDLFLRAGFKESERLGTVSRFVAIGELRFPDHIKLVS